MAEQPIQQMVLGHLCFQERTEQWLCMYLCMYVCMYEIVCMYVLVYSE